MAKEDDAALKRILYIEERQAALIKAAESLQGSLLARLTAVVGAIQQSPDPAIDAVFDGFSRNESAKVVGQFAKDIVGIGSLNAEYFGKIVGLSPKNYQAIQSTAEDYLLKRFGLGRDGKPTKNGFLESFIADPTLRRQVKQYAYKTKGSGAGLGEFTKGLGDLLNGVDESAGPIVKYYKTFALDTYQQADREIQEQAAERLKMSAFIYAGGLIKSSRSFCVSRNGKVFTRDEALEWKDLSFDGKPTNYDPLRDLGGYACRHHKNYISDAMAVRRRPELGDVLKPGSKDAEAPKEEAVEEVRQTPPAKREPKKDAPKVYRDQAEFEASGAEGGWAMNAEVEIFNQVVGGMDISRLGKLVREQVEGAGIVIGEMQLTSFGGSQIQITMIGEKKGEFFQLTRTFGANPQTGQRFVEHDLLKIPKALQGKGFTKELFQNFYQEYKAADVASMNLHANLDVGGYAWGKYGFEADGKEYVDGVLEHAFAKKRKLGNSHEPTSGTYKRMKDYADEFYKNNPEEAPFPMDMFANVKGGKELLLGSEWYGTLNLKNPERRAMWEAYLNKK